MRQRRLTPVAPIAQPGGELCQFDPREWMSPRNQGPHDTPFIRWLQARRRWIDAHGADGFGGWLALLRVEHHALISLHAHREQQ